MPQVNNSLKTALLTVLFIFVSLLVYTKLFGPIPFSVRSSMTMSPESFSVSGEGEASAIPDTAMINVGVTKKAATVKEAQNEANKIINAITEELKKLGVTEKNIKTTNYSVNPEYDYTIKRGSTTTAVPAMDVTQSSIEPAMPESIIIEQQGQTISGYTVTQNLEIKITPIEKANEAVDIVTAKGANMVGGIYFTLNDEKLEELQQQAREAAIKKAKDKAKDISKVSGVRLGRIINIQEGQNYDYPRSYMMNVGKEAGMGDSGTNLTPGENNVQMTVTLYYEIL